MRAVDLRLALEHNDAGELGEDLRERLQAEDLSALWTRAVEQNGGDEDAAVETIATRAGVELDAVRDVAVDEAAIADGANPPDHLEQPGGES